MFNSDTLNNLRILEATVMEQQRALYRDMPWRHTPNPYYVVVSEMMLQQTQVSRVLTKFPSFIAAFPTVRSVAYATLADIVSIWQGLGYNRRALYLARSAKIIVEQCHGVIPHTMERLMALPGIGVATAGAIIAYGYNQPTLFIETNIRRVFIHFCFQESACVDDVEILPLLAHTLIGKDVRAWYYALTDYGALLAKTDNPNKKSKQYHKQSQFVGSHRALRGAILRAIIHNGNVRIPEIMHALPYAPHEIEQAFSELQQEGFIVGTRRRGYLLQK